jgi:hypothetical protein
VAYTTEQMFPPSRFPRPVVGPGVIVIRECRCGKTRPRNGK